MNVNALVGLARVARDSRLSTQHASNSTIIGLNLGMTPPYFNFCKV